MRMKDRRDVLTDRVAYSMKEETEEVVRDRAIEMFGNPHFVRDFMADDVEVLARGVDNLARESLTPTFQVTPEIANVDFVSRVAEVLRMCRSNDYLKIAENLICFVFMFWAKAKSFETCVFENGIWQAVQEYLVCESSGCRTSALKALYHFVKINRAYAVVVLRGGIVDDLDRFWSLEHSSWQEDREALDVVALLYESVEPEMAESIDVLTARFLPFIADRHPVMRGLAARSVIKAMKRDSGYACLREHDLLEYLFAANELNPHSQTRSLYKMIRYAIVREEPSAFVCPNVFLQFGKMLNEECNQYVANDATYSSVCKVMRLLMERHPGEFYALLPKLLDLAKYGRARTRIESAACVAVFLRFAAPEHVDHVLSHDGFSVVTDILPAMNGEALKQSLISVFELVRRDLVILTDADIHTLELVSESAVSTECAEIIAGIRLEQTKKQQCSI